MPCRPLFDSVILFKNQSYQKQVDNWADNGIEYINAFQNTKYIFFVDTIKSFKKNGQKNYPKF